MLTRVVLGCLLVIVTACGGPSTSSIPTGRPSPTPDPAVAQVKATVEAYMAAEFQSGLSGDATQAESYVFQDAPEAVSAATVSASIAHDSHLTARVISDTFSNWAVDANTGTATADFDIAGTVQDVSFPGLVASGQPRAFGPNHHHFGLIENAGKWFISEIS